MAAVSLYFIEFALLVYGVSIAAVSLYFTRASILVLNDAVSTLRKYGTSIVAVSVYFTRRLIFEASAVLSVKTFDVLA